MERRRTRFSEDAPWLVAAALGGAVLAVGSVLPWTSFSTDTASITHDGIALGLGALTGILGLVWLAAAPILVIVRRTNRLAGVLAIAGGGLAVLIAVVALVVDGVAPGGRLSDAIGCDLTVIGGVVLVVGGLGVLWPGPERMKPGAK